MRKEVSYQKGWAMNQAQRAPAFHRSRFYRVYYIHRQVQARTYPNTPRLAAFLEVARRSVERDLEYLRDMLGAPLVYDHHRRGYYYAEEFKMPPLTLSQGEVVAIFLAHKLLAQVAGTALEEPVCSAFAKIQQWLPESVTINEELWDQTLAFQILPLRGDEEVVAAHYQQLAAAIEQHLSVYVCYYTASRDELTERRLDPYHLVYHNSAWYMVAYCHLRQAVQIFSLDRIRSLNVLDQQFQLQPGFSLAAYLAESFCIERGQSPEEIVICFAPEAARFVRERCWHASQQIEEQPDGSLFLKLTVSGLGEVKRWVLSFGSNAEIMAPENLRREIARDAKAMATKYRNPKS